MVGGIGRKEYKEINRCKSCVEFERGGYCKFFNAFIDAQDEACSYYEERVEVLTVTWNCPVDAHGCETLPPSSVQAKNDERIGEAFRKAKKLVVGYLSE